MVCMAGRMHHIILEKCGAMATKRQSSVREISERFTPYQLLLHYLYRSNEDGSIIHGGIRHDTYYSPPLLAYYIGMCTTPYLHCFLALVLRVSKCWKYERTWFYYCCYYVRQFILTATFPRRTLLLHTGTTYRPLIFTARSYNDTLPSQYTEYEIHFVYSYNQSVCCGVVE